ncbi:MAG: hydrogenase maturation protease [Bacteroidota bacterium]
MSPQFSILVLGLGNEYRCDDAVGLEVARRLRNLSLESTIVSEESGEGANLMEAWKSASTVIVVDAVSSGSEPGMIHRFVAESQRIPSKFFHYSSHSFGLAEAIELARSLHQLPQHLVVYGIEGSKFEAGIGLSFEVERAAEKVVDRIRQEDCFPPMK